MTQEQYSKRIAAIKKPTLPAKSKIGLVNQIKQILKQG
jgi:hypothetical protein